MTQSSLHPVWHPLVPVLLIFGKFSHFFLLFSFLYLEGYVLLSSSIRSGFNYTVSIRGKTRVNRSLVCLCLSFFCKQVEILGIDFPNVSTYSRWNNLGDVFFVDVPKMNVGINLLIKWDIFILPFYSVFRFIYFWFCQLLSSILQHLNFPSGDQ